MAHKKIRNAAPLTDYLAISSCYYVARPSGYCPLTASVSRKMDYPEGALAGIAFGLPCVGSDFDKNNTVPARFYSPKDQGTIDHVQQFDNCEGAL